MSVIFTPIAWCMLQAINIVCAQLCDNASLSLSENVPLGKEHLRRVRTRPNTRRGLPVTDTNPNTLSRTCIQTHVRPDCRSLLRSRSTPCWAVVLFQKIIAGHTHTHASSKHLPSVAACDTALKSPGIMFRLCVQDTNQPPSPFVRWLLL